MKFLQAFYETTKACSDSAVFDRAVQCMHKITAEIKKAHPGLGDNSV